MRFFEIEFIFSLLLRYNSVLIVGSTLYWLWINTGILNLIIYSLFLKVLLKKLKEISVNKKRDKEDK